MPTALAIEGRFFGLEAEADGGWTLESLKELALEADSSGIDFLVLPDNLSGWPEPTLLASWLAAQTTTLGLLTKVSTIPHQPYNLARRIASVDLISKGRGGWIVGDDDSDEEYAAYSGGRRIARDTIAERADEFVAVVEGLWQSWDADALVLDREGGRFFDTAKMQHLDHTGAHFSVKGPLNVMRSPQDRPVLGRLADGDLVLDDGTRLRQLTADDATGDGNFLITITSPAEARAVLRLLPRHTTAASTLRKRVQGASA